MSYEANKKWRKGNVKARNAQRKRYYGKSNKDNPNRGKLYELQDDLIIIKHSDIDKSLADKLGRSLQSVQLRRHRIFNEDPYMRFKQKVPAKVITEFIERIKNHETSRKENSPGGDGKDR